MEKKKDSLPAFVEGVARLLRKEVSLKDRKAKVIKEDSGVPHKIEQIALLLRKQVHRVRKKSKS
jgi:hypothetical protein